MKVNDDLAPSRSYVYLSVLGLALLVRVAWALAIPVIPISDAVVYDLMAKHIAMGHGPSLQPLDTPSDQIQHSAYWPVGASAIYGGLYTLFGFTTWPIVAINILANIATIGLMMRLAERWLTWRHALFTGIVLALWPAQIMFSTVPASELLFAFFLVAALAVWEKDWRVWVLRGVFAGVLLAVACLIRPTALLIPALLGLTSVFQGPHRRWHGNLVGSAGVCGATMLLCILPWSMYNQSQFGQLVLISTNGGPNFWMGNHLGTNGGYTDLPSEVKGMNEIERAQFLSSAAMDYIRAEPIEFVMRSIIKAVRLHERESIGVTWNMEGLNERLKSDNVIFGIKLGANVYWWLMLGLAVTGTVYVAWSQPRHLLMLAVPLLFWGYFTAVHAITVIQDRYHFPSVPFIAVLASIPLTVLWERVTKQSGRNAAQSIPPS